MSVIYFIRHSQASFAADNYDKLSEKGHQQSGILAEYLAEHGPGFNAVYSGSMERHRDTMEPVLNALNSDTGRLAPTILPGFNEYQSDRIVKSHLPMVLEENPDLNQYTDTMLTDKKSFQKIFEFIMTAWVDGRYDIDGVETWIQFRDRVNNAVRQIMAEAGRGKTVLAFTSGGPIGVIMQMALGLEDQKAIRVNWVVRNASISTFFYNDSGIMLSSFNEVSHLEQQSDKTLITYR
jgi:broad specificity phosphatase PhoE